MDKDNLILFSRDEKAKELSDEFIATVRYKDGEIQEVVATFFGNAPDSTHLLVFFNENVSENPIALVNSTEIKRVDMKDILPADKSVQH